MYCCWPQFGDELVFLAYASSEKLLKVELHSSYAPRALYCPLCVTDAEVMIMPSQSATSPHSSCPSASKQTVIHPQPHNLTTRPIVVYRARRNQYSYSIMAPQRKRDNRENAFFNVGVQGRSVNKHSITMCAQLTALTERLVSH